MSELDLIIALHRKSWRQGPGSEKDSTSKKIKILKAKGFSLVGYFTLSQENWIENYYKPLESLFGTFFDGSKNSDLAKKVVRDYISETELYMKYKEFYSYGFYIAKKTE